MDKITEIRTQNDAKPLATEILTISNTDFEKVQKCGRLIIRPENSCICEVFYRDEI